MSSTDDNKARLPLADVRVLDLTRVLAGPYCTLLLADLGAEVVKVEHPGRGDDSRGFGPFLPSGESAYFASLNRGKKSVCLNLKEAADRSRLEELAAAADVLVENYRPGVLESLGLGPARLRTRNPRLVYASITGFGQQGPAADRPTYDLIIQALSGLISLTGHENQPPVRVGVSISDILSGLFTALGIVAELRRRDQGGTAARIDMAMLDCTVGVLENAISRYSVSGQTPQPLGNRHPSIAPFQSFPTATGALVLAIGNESSWQRLCRALALDELLEDPRFTNNAARCAHQGELESQLAGKLVTRPTEDWLELLRKADIAAAAVRSIPEVLEDPQLQARGMLEEVVTGSADRFVSSGSPLRAALSAAGGESHGRRAPHLGEHTETVFHSWRRAT